MGKANVKPGSQQRFTLTDGPLKRLIDIIGRSGVPFRRFTPVRAEVRRESPLPQVGSPPGVPPANLVLFAALVEAIAPELPNGFGKIEAMTRLI